jgi:hypothetical protein
MVETMGYFKIMGCLLIAHVFKRGKLKVPPNNNNRFNGLDTYALYLRYG